MYIFTRGGLGTNNGQNPYWEHPEDPYMLLAPKHSGV